MREKGTEFFFRSTALMTTAEDFIDNVTMNLHVTNALVVFKTACVYFQI